MREHQLATGREEGFVFATVGTLIAQLNLTRHFHASLVKLGLPKQRFHDLRHTYASLLIDQGENIKYIQNQLGHSSPSVTLDVYAHLLKPSNPQAATRLEKTVFSESGHKMVTTGTSK